jgi:hypothetical protein
MGKLILVALRRGYDLPSTTSDYEVRVLGSNSKFHFCYFENRVQNHPESGSSGGQGPMLTDRQQSHMGEENGDSEDKNGGAEMEPSTVPDPNDRGSRSANTGQERTDQGFSRMETSPSSGYDREGPSHSVNENDGAEVEADTDRGGTDRERSCVEAGPSRGYDREGPTHSANENDGEVEIDTVPDPNDRDSRSANTSRGGTDQDPSCVEAGPSRGSDGGDQVIDVSALKPYTSPRYPEELDFQTLNSLNELVDSGDAYVIALGGWWNDFVDNVTVQAWIFLPLIVIGAVWCIILHTVEKEQPNECWKHFNGVSTHKEKKMYLFIVVLIGSLHAASYSLLVPLAKVCPCLMKLPEGRKMKLQSVKRDVYDFLDFLRTHVRALAKVCHCLMKLLEGREEKPQSKKKVVRILLGFLRTVFFPVSVSFGLSVAVYCLHSSAVGNGEKFYGPEEKRNNALHKLLYILLGCGQAVFETLLRLVFQVWEIENEATLATQKIAMASAPLLVAAFSKHEPRSPKRIDAFLRATPAFNYCTVIGAKLAMDVLTKVIRIPLGLLSRERFSKLRWSTKLKFSVPVHNRLEVVSELLDVLLLALQCGQVENSYKDNFIFVIIYIAVTILKKGFYNSRPAKLHRPLKKRQSRSKIVECLLFSHISGFLAIYASLPELLRANLCSFEGEWKLPARVATVAYIANLLAFGSGYWLLDLLQRCWAARRAHPNLPTHSDVARQETE